MRKFIENTGFWLLIVTFLAVLAMFVSGFFGIDRYLFEAHCWKVLNCYYQTCYKHLNTTSCKAPIELIKFS